MSGSILDDAELVQNESADNTNWDDDTIGARIKVFGVGGAGGNAIQHMIESGLQGVHFICANTDKQAMKRISAETMLQLGEKLTRGRGAGANPKVGREAAMESINAIRDAIGDAEMLFVTAGMGGGTGTGGAAVVAQVAKEMNVLTVGVVTKPFNLEGAKRAKTAEEGLAELKQYVDCLITIPNERLFGLAPKKASFQDMLHRSNEVLYQAVKGIADVVNTDGLINLDFADVRTTMSEAGLALMGTGIGTGENRAREATQRAITSPLLEDVSLGSAKAILYNITASRDITTAEIQEIGSMIHDAAPEECNIIFGVAFDDNIGDEIHVTLIATGIEAQEEIIPPMETLEKRGVSPARSNRIPFSSKAQGQPQMQSMRPQGLGAQELHANEAAHLDQGMDSSREEAVHTQGNYYGDQSSDFPFMNRLPRTTRPRRSTYQPGQDTFVFNEDDADEIPTFIRRQAD